MKPAEVLSTVLSRRDRWEAHLRRQLPASEVDDVFQKALISAARNITQLRDEEAVHAWFRAVLRNAIVDEARELARRARLRSRLAEATPDEVEVPTHARETCACSLERLAELPAPYRDILRRHDVAEEPLGDIASELGVSVNNATVRLHRARKALRERLVACCTDSSSACANCACTRESSATV